MINRLKEKSRTLSELMHNNSIADIGKRYVTLDEAVEVLRDGRREEILKCITNFEKTWQSVLKQSASMDLFFDRMMINFKSQLESLAQPLPTPQKENNDGC